MSKRTLMLLVTGLIMSQVFFPFIATAQGNLLLTPRRIVFEGNMRSIDLNLANVGNDTATYAISIVQIRMTEEGNFETITEPDNGQKFASQNLRFFPRSVTLGPNEAQTAKVQLVRANQLTPGEYRSHFYFRAVPVEKPLGKPIGRDGEVGDILCRTLGCRGTASRSIRLVPLKPSNWHHGRRAQTQLACTPGANPASPGDVSETRHLRTEAYEAAAYLKITDETLRADLASVVAYHADKERKPGATLKDGISLLRQGARLPLDDWNRSKFGNSKPIRMVRELGLWLGLAYLAPDWDAARSNIDFHFGKDLMRTYRNQFNSKWMKDSRFLEILSWVHLTRRGIHLLRKRLETALCRYVEWAPCWGHVFARTFCHLFAHAFRSRAFSQNGARRQGSASPRPTTARP